MLGDQNSTFLYKHLVQKKCPLSVVGRVRYIEKYFKEFMKEKFRSVKICPLWASVRLSRVSVRTGFPVYQKYMQTSARVDYAPPIWKRAQVQWLKESRLTIRGAMIRDLVSSEEIWTSPFI